MTIAYWCVLLMIVSPYIFTVMAKSTANFDNSDPRTYLQGLDGWRKRANYVQLNSFEMVPLFGIAVIIAHNIHANQAYINMLAVVFVLSRICYSVCYILNKSNLRSLFWGIGFGCTLGLFFLR